MQRQVEERWFRLLEDAVEPWERERFDDEADRADAFSGDVSFGTGGIRALMGIGPNRLNTLTVARASAGLATYLRGLDRATSQVVIAYDTRLHSRDFAYVAAQVLAAAGVRVALFARHQPTPVLSFAVRYLHADAGIVITASHNPMEYNGYKVYGPTGEQATDALAHAVQEAIAGIDPFGIAQMDMDEALAEGRVTWAPPELLDAYLQAVVDQSAGVDCGDVRLAYSPLNGTGLEPVRRVCETRGIACDVVAAQAEPDGHFSTCPKPNPELASAMGRVMELALSEGSDVAIANDPDADRIGVAVRHGGTMHLLSGDEVGLLLFDFLCSVAPRPGHAVALTTIVSTPLHDSIARENNVQLRRTLTGFKYIGEQITLLEEQGRADDFLLGVEESCGYLRGSYVRDKDGIVAMMLICELVAWHKAQGRDLVQALETLHDRYGHTSARQVSVRLPGIEGRERMARLMAEFRAHVPSHVGGLAVREMTDYAQGSPMPGDPTQTLPKANVLEFHLDHGCKLIVRPSGTEPKIKAYCFAVAPTAERADELLRDLSGAVQALLDAEKE